MCTGESGETLVAAWAVHLTCLWLALKTTVIYFSHLGYAQIMTLMCWWGDRGEWLQTACLLTGPYGRQGAHSRDGNMGDSASTCLQVGLLIRLFINLFAIWPFFFHLLARLFQETRKWGPGVSFYIDIPTCNGLYLLCISNMESSGDLMLHSVFTTRIVKCIK